MHDKRQNDEGKIIQPTLILLTTDSLQIKHFLTRGAQPEQQVTWLQGWNNISLLASEHTRHSSKVEFTLTFWVFWCDPMSISPLCFSLWHFVSVLHRLGSGQRSRGVCPFLFLIVRSAPLPTINKINEYTGCSLYWNVYTFTVHCWYRIVH